MEETIIVKTMCQRNDMRYDRAGMNDIVAACGLNKPYYVSRDSAENCIFKDKDGELVFGRMYSFKVYCK